MSQTPEIFLFLGRFHPLLVHLPIGLLLVLLVVEAVAKIPRFHTVGHSSRLILGLAAMSAVGSATFGWMLSHGGDYDPHLLQWHKWSGFGVAGAAVVTFVFHCLDWRKIYHALLFATFLVVSVASHFGGSLTHGKDYLTEHAPERIRAWLGVGPKKKAKPKNQNADPEQAVVYTDLVQPVLDQKCTACHNPEKLKGGLRADSLAAMLKGGKAGPAVIAGKANDSPLIQRILLPIEDDKHMPPNGKPQLTDNEVALIQWWIDSGVSADKKVADLNPPVRVLSVLDALFGHAAADAPEPRKPEEIEAVALRLSEQLGIVIAPLAQGEPWLEVNANGVKTFGDADLAKLDPVRANIRWLNLAGTKITDAGAAQIAAMPSVTQLHLERTAITDAGLKPLTKLRDLEYLNLYGTGVTDAGLQSIKRMAKLQRLYLWQTKVTPQAVQRLADEFVDKQKIEHWQQEIETLETRIKSLNLDVNTGEKPSVPKPSATAPKPAPAKVAASAQEEKSPPPSAPPNPDAPAKAR